MDREIATGITLLRVVSHKSYGFIAEQLDIPVNTVKSFCQRHGLGDEVIHDPKAPRKLSPKGSKKDTGPKIGYCIECGAAFTQCKNGGRKYCSTLCANRWRRKNGNGKYKQVCPICGKEYPVFDLQKPRKYCSQECYRTARYYLEDPSRETVSYCEVCGKKIVLPGHKKRRFCGHECYHISQRKEDIEVK